MDKLQQMRAFMTVAEEQGFAAAARKLGTSPPSVTRLVAALEENLGVQLLVRTTRSVRVTGAGERYLDDVRQILSLVAAADETANGINAAPQGGIAVTAPVMFGNRYVMPGIVDYLETFPATEVKTLFVDRVVNLVEEGLDVGVRIGQLPDSSLRAIKVGEVCSVVVAAPGYLEAAGSPKTPQALREHTIIISTAGDSSHGWRFNNAGDYPIRLKPRLQTTTNDSAVNAAVRGFGITRLLSYQVADELAAGSLVRLLEEFEPAPVPVHIVHREGQFASTRVRAFIDLLAEHLRGRLTQT